MEWVVVGLSLVGLGLLYGVVSTIEAGVRLEHFFDDMDRIQDEEQSDKA